jgi:hypothetical protein
MENVDASGPSGVGDLVSEPAFFGPGVEADAREVVSGT